MTADEYWHGSPELTQAYRAAHKIRKEEKNWECWLQGLYFYHAMNVALSNAVGGKEEYMSKPISLFPPSKEELEEQQEKEAEQLYKALNAFAERFNGNT